MLTDNAIELAKLCKNRGRYFEMEAMFSGHTFDRVCKEHGIEHRLTKPYHPWTNGQAERRNRTVKDVDVKTFYYSSLDALKAHVLAFVSAYSFAKHLKAIKRQTLFQHICDARQRNPSAFRVSPRHLTLGPYT